MSLFGRAQIMGGRQTQSGTLPAAILALSPVGYWKLDEPSGTTAVDSSGNGRDGTYVGSGYTLQGATGGDGNLYTDFGNGGASSRANIPDHDAWSVNTSSGLSVFVLMKPDSVSGTTALHALGKGGIGGTDFEWGLHICNGVAGRCQFWVLTAAGSGIQNGRMSGDPLTTNWQAVVAATGTPTSGAAYGFYRNSNTDIYTSITASASTYTNGPDDLLIGWGSNTPATGYFQGGLAHVAIFAGQLNATQVDSLMDAADADGWF